MNACARLLHNGGWPIVAILALGVVLYSRCFRLLLSLWWARRQLRAIRAGIHGPDAWRDQRRSVENAFQQQRISLGAMIAAAPLLGLLGTVSGMATTFESLGAGAGDKSMEGLARGISEVLVATEAGLAVAIPAMALVFLAHREVRHFTRAVTRLERHSAAGTP